MLYKKILKEKLNKDNIDFINKTLKQILLEDDVSLNISIIDNDKSELNTIEHNYIYTENLFKILEGLINIDKLNVVIGVYNIVDTYIKLKINIIDGNEEELIELLLVNGCLFRLDN